MRWRRRAGERVSRWREVLCSVDTMTDYEATITSKLQLTLPKRLCAQLGITRGDKVAVTVERGAIVLTPLRTAVEAAAGSLCSK